MKNNIFVTSIKGFIVGSTMLVPGVSGGSMAMILGIYKKLISSISNLRKDLKNNLIFLFIFCIGSVLGMITLSNPIMHLIANHPKPTLYFFIGAVSGSIPTIWRETKITRVKPRHFLYVFLGIIIVVFISLIPDSTEINKHIPKSFEVLYLVLVGMILAIALILPGISISFMLLIMGIYEKVMNAIGSLDIFYLLPLIAGIVIGIFISTGLLEKAMMRYPQATYLIILGFILGSLPDTFPGLPTYLEWIYCSITLALGFSSIYFLSAFENKKSRNYK